VIVVPISSASGSKLYLRVVAVDFELRLYQDGTEVFDAQKDQANSEFSLNRDSSYVIRYNNNDGGPGALHFKVFEESAQRYEINLGAIHSPDVIELPFSLKPAANISPP
jgi:hypothetical protein